MVLDSENALCAPLRGHSLVGDSPHSSFPLLFLFLSPPSYIGRWGKRRKRRGERRLRVATGPCMRANGPERRSRNLWSVLIHCLGRNLFSFVPVRPINNEWTDTQRINFFLSCPDLSHKGKKKQVVTVRTKKKEIILWIKELGPQQWTLDSLTLSPIVGGRSPWLNKYLPPAASIGESARRRKAISSFKFLFIFVSVIHGKKSLNDPWIRDKEEEKKLGTY